MGVDKNNLTRIKPKFTSNDVNNRELVIKMLQFEETFTKSEEGQNMYRNPLNRPFVSLTVEKAINRVVLRQFGFDTSDESVETYRTIFKTYFKNPTDYDREVIHSVHYMRENKCVYYQYPPIEVGETIPTTAVYTLDGKCVDLYDVIRSESPLNSLNDQPKVTVVAAFSLS